MIVWMEIASNGLLITILCTVLVYLIRLNKDIKILRHYKDELDTFNHTFSEAVIRAEHGIHSMHHQKKLIDEEINAKLQDAIDQKADLTYMIDRAQSMIEKLAIPLPTAVKVSAEVAAPTAAIETSTANITDPIKTAVAQSLAAIPADAVAPASILPIPTELHNDDSDKPLQQRAQALLKVLARLR